MCTSIRFSDDKGNMFFGRNLDWSTGYGEKVTLTPASYTYDSAFLGRLISKTGAIIGMAIVAEDKPLYFDCANEAGLAIAGLNFPGYAAYASSEIKGKTNVAAYEFPLYVAMNFKTVQEAKKALKDVTIVAKPLSPDYPVSELHYLIGDGKESIVVEYTKNGMEIFDNPVDVLTNQPGYAWHQENLRNYMNLFAEMPREVKWNKATLTPFGTGSLIRGLPGDYYSPSRFVRVAYLNTHYPTQSTEAANVSRLFHTLSSIAMIAGAAKMADGQSEITIYTGGYSAATKTYYHSTYDNPTIIATKISDFDLTSSKIQQK